MKPPEYDPCAELRLLIQSEIDGELTAAEVARIVAHREACPSCAATHAALSVLRKELRQTLDCHAAPPALRERLRTGLDLPQDKIVPLQRIQPLGRVGIGFGAGAVAMAASLLLLLRSPTPEISNLVMAGHIRALQPGHLMDVVSTDQHNVKPWFDGRLDFAPPVRNLAGIGFPLQGARLDYLEGRAVAAMVYKSRQHIIDLYVWPDPEARNSAPRLEVLNGYNLYHWTTSGMTLWAVSDLNTGELSSFVRSWNGER